KLETGVQTCALPIYLVMEHLDFDALLLERERDRVADVLQGVDRRHRKIAAFDGSAMCHVAAFVFLARRPWRLLRLDLDKTAGHEIGRASCRERRQSW